MPTFVKAYGLTGVAAKDADVISNIVSTLQGGCFVGALVAYYTADKYGRKVSFSWLLMSTMLIMM